MKNIAIIIPSLKGGGAERVVSLISQKLSSKYNLFLIVFDSEDMAYSYGGNLVDINIKSHNNILFKIINVIRRVCRVSKVKRKYNIKSSISFLTSANIINILSRVDDKIFISVHSHLSKNEKNRFYYINRIIIKLLYNKADNIVAISNGVAKDLIKEYGLDNELISYIYNPVDIGSIKELSLESIHNYNLSEDNFFTIVTVGRLTNAKGQWHLIRAMNYIKKEVKNVKLLILGQGELEGYLRSLVTKLELQDNVIFLGYHKNPFKFISKSDLFVLTSLYEGFGNVIIEAMACGIPIISTDCKSGPREIIAPGTDIEYETEDIDYCEYGILVPVCDGKHYEYDDPLTNEERLLAKSIINLYKDEKLRKKYSTRGKERVKDFCIDNIIEQWQVLINDTNI